MLTSADIQAFEERGLDPEIADKLGAKFSNGKFRFDYRKDGELLFSKVRTLEKGFWIEPKGAKLEFWGLDEVPVLPHRPSEPLVITEGEFDRVAVIQSAGGYALSVPNGVAGKRSEGEIVIAEDTRFAYLWQDERLIPQVEQFDKVILFVDGDEPGQILRDELALRIGEPRCWFVNYPRGCKDPNDVLLKHGPKGIQLMLERAKPMRPGHLVRPSDLPPKTNSVAYSTGWGFLDKNLMFVRPEMMVVTGEPGHGKGQWIRALCLQLARAHGWRTALLTPEDPPHRLRRDMLKFANGRERSSDQSVQRQRDAWIDDHFRISTPPEDEPITLSMVMDEMESAALHHNCQVFVLDPWNEIEHDYVRGETETQYIERALRAFKRKVRRLNLLLIIAAHPTKHKKGDDINLWSISGSANWRNKADHGLIIKRESEYSNDVELVVEKCKDHETMGVPGSIHMEFLVNTCDYRPTVGVSLKE